MESVGLLQSPFTNAVSNPTGIPVYIHDEMYQHVMTVSNTAAGLIQDVVTCYT